MPEPLRKRIRPSVPLKLELEDEGGARFTRNFKLAFDFNAVRAVEEKTGFSLLRGEVWTHQTATVLTALFWAAVLIHHPEYDTKDENGFRTGEGLEVLGSYMDEANSDQISEAVWQAYLNYLSPAKRDVLVRARERIEKGLPTTPAPAETLPASSDGPSSGPSADTTSDSAMKKSAS